ncbi:hypothetical protein M2139_000422 [Enterococcus sp. PF1-24]|uniref:hypothetical protein n=1 Tax=unclassified Enterococcus TaxID=2608891 RepID=UPI0024751283|nr:MULTISPECIES: hypothetical protein [unclassified Enterococcus]MDH6363447.1 hypothetical protein [Enterococcus sp. PFB1-1]MDH6400541.1 hypothetical protein [Enterococcus sp. PF1-24]
MGNFKMIAKRLGKFFAIYIVVVGGVAGLYFFISASNKQFVEEKTEKAAALAELSIGDRYQCFRPFTVNVSVAEMSEDYSVEEDSLWKIEKIREDSVILVDEADVLIELRPSQLRIYFVKLGDYVIN